MKHNPSFSKTFCLLQIRALTTFYVVHSLFTCQHTGTQFMHDTGWCLDLCSFRLNLQPGKGWCKKLDCLWHTPISWLGLEGHQVMVNITVIVIFALSRDDFFKASPHCSFPRTCRSVDKKVWYKAWFGGSFCCGGVVVIPIGMPQSTGLQVTYHTENKSHPLHS